MQNKFCKICSSKVDQVFRAKILQKYNADFLYCDECGFLQIDDPVWLQEAYKNPINICDTGIISRNIYFSKFSSILITLIYGINGQFLDYGGGYGIFTRVMRDIGFDYYWYDPFSNNLLAKGFEYDPNDQQISLVTSWECFEHFKNPLHDLNNILSISKNILFSTELLPEPIPSPNSWWYYGLENGQHISFYSRRTLKYLAELYGLNFYTNGTIHLFTKKRLNRFTFHSIDWLSKIGFPSFIKLMIKSKTEEDMNKMMEKLFGSHENTY